jgi:hypothetical protein
MGFFTWIKEFLQPQGDTVRVNSQTMPLAKWKRNGGYQPCSHGGTPNPPPSDFDEYFDREIDRRRGSNPPAPGSNGGPVTPEPPIKPQPTGGRLIYTDRDPGPIPPRLPDDLADLPVMPAEILAGAAAAPAPAEMPSDELMGQWKAAAFAEYRAGGEPTWLTAALLAFAEGRRQAQSPQLPPPGAEPVATDEELMEELMDLWPGCMPSTVRRTIYQKGRADERTAILRALGVQP